MVEIVEGYQNISPLLAGLYYDHVSRLLSYDEKTIILNWLLKDSHKWAIELAQLHDDHGHLSKAIETLKTWLTKNRTPYYSYEDAWSLYEAIADAVRHLVKVNRAKADEYIHFMRKNYNRRRNLMSLLNEISITK